MTIGIKILQLLQTKQSDCVENRKLIIELLKNGELDKLISNIAMNRKVQLINFKLFEKNQLNGLEQFVINLDAFISYFCYKLLVGGSFQYVLATIFLKSKYNYILLDNRFIYDGGENQRISCFDGLKKSGSISFSITGLSSSASFFASASLFSPVTAIRMWLARRSSGVEKR